MTDFEVMFEALKNLFALLKDKQLDDKQRNKIMSRLYSLQKEVKEIQFIFDLL